MAVLSVSMCQITEDTDMTSLWRSSSHWATQSSRSLICSWPVSWLLHCRFSINVCWPLNTHGKEGIQAGPRYMVNYFWGYCLYSFLAPTKGPDLNIFQQSPPSISPNRKPTASWSHFFVKVRMVTEFEFGMEIAFLLLYAFSPFSAFGFKHL